MNPTMDWIKHNLHPEGGVRAWPTGPAYPEITGYLIPTLLDYSEDDLARDFADWLLTIQNLDGSFNGVDGHPRTFDTAACYEGLCAAFIKFHNLSYVTASARARQWLENMHDGGVFRVSDKQRSSHVYTLRINGLLGIQRNPPEKLYPNRAHYIAYALEGAWALGWQDYVKEQLEWIGQRLRGGIAPFEIFEHSSTETDLCATAQLGILFIKAGFGANGTLESLHRLRRQSGGFTVKQNDGSEVSWAAKYYLDLARLYEYAS